MENENESKLDELRYLADNLYTMHRRGGMQNETYVLFLGGEASTISDHSFIDALRVQVLQIKGSRQYGMDKILEMSPEEQIRRFDEKWLSLSRVQRNQNLRDLLQTQQAFTPGQKALAMLLKDRYFPLVL